MEEIEKINALLKPYITKLSIMKNKLTLQLQDLIDTKAYISLGVFFFFYDYDDYH